MDVGRRYPPVQKQLRLLQRHAYELAVLACCRFIPHTILQNQGIPSDLRLRLKIAFGAIPSDLRMRWKGFLALEEGNPLLPKLEQSNDCIFNRACALGEEKFQGKHRLGHEGGQLAAR